MIAPAPHWSARRPLILGFATLLLLFGALGAWGLGTRVAGAVVAFGVVEVELERQILQHPDGGVVAELRVREGDRVEAGAILLRLDDTYLSSELDLVRRQLVELQARHARLRAERDGGTTLVVPRSGGEETVAEDWILEQIRGQTELFMARRVTFLQEQEQLEEQRKQIGFQIEGIGAQLQALDQQLQINREERIGLEPLLEQGLVPAARVLELRREEALLHGRIGGLEASAAEARARRAALRIESLKRHDDRRRDAISGLRDLHFAQIELEERARTLAKRLSRLDLRAPVSGIIFDTQVFAKDAVIAPAAPIMTVVPTDRPLQVLVRVAARDIDQVHVGQPATLFFNTVSHSPMQELPGTVRRISAGTLQQATTGSAYYEVIVAPDPSALSKLDALSPVPGMPVDVFLKTGERTPLAYLTQPLLAYLNRALRAE